MATTNPKSTSRTTPKGTTQAKAKKQITSAKEWKSSSRTPVELELPSGNVCLAINKGMKVFLQEGEIPNSFMEIVQAGIDGAENKAKKALKKADEDPNLLKEMFQAMDHIVVSCVIQPVIMPAPVATVDDESRGDVSTKQVIVELGHPVIDISGETIERDPDVLYVDDVDLEDKMFIFSWCVGGTTDLEQFRKQYEKSMADVPDGEAVEQEAE
jgi:hypothetical protein